MIPVVGLYKRLGNACGDVDHLEIACADKAIVTLYSLAIPLSCVVRSSLSDVSLCELYYPHFVCKKKGAPWFTFCQCIVFSLIAK